MKTMRLGLGVVLLVSLGVLAPRMLAQPKADPPRVAHYDATPGAGVAALVKQLDSKDMTVRKGAEAKIASCGACHKSHPLLQHLVGVAAGATPRLARSGPCLRTCHSHRALAPTDRGTRSFSRG